MENQLHEAVIERIIELYEQGQEAIDIFDQLDSRVEFEAIEHVIAEYESHEPDEFEYDHDDMFDIESALGSVGWGTDEYYE